MSIWMENMTNQFNVVEDKMKEIANLDWDDDHEGEIDEYNKQLKPQLERLGRQMAYGGQWMVLLFDKGTSNISVIVLICANISESTLRDSGSSSIAQYRVQWVCAISTIIYDFDLQDVMLYTRCIITQTLCFELCAISYRSILSYLSPSHAHIFIWRLFSESHRHPRTLSLHQREVLLVRRVSKGRSGATIAGDDGSQKGLEYAREAPGQCFWREDDVPETIWALIQRACLQFIGQSRLSRRTFLRSVIIHLEQILGRHDVRTRWSKFIYTIFQFEIWYIDSKRF